MKLISKLVIAAFAASAAVTAGAQEAGNSGYLVDGSGNVVMSGGGGCWHTGAWTPELAIEPCDPSLKPVAAYVPPVQEAAPAPEPVAAAPEPVAAAPALAPEPVAAPQPQPQAISFSGDALFAFDQSELTPEGKAVLDDLIGQMQGASFDRIAVTGHTDRIGEREYNQQLSERRADAVKAYLVSKNVAAESIDAQGMGSSQPSIAQSECRDLQGAEATIACLQPDRRVDVEMTGTRMMLGASESAGENLDDTAITAKVKAAILGDASLNANDISVTTVRGAVQLSGFVESSDDIARAGTVAEEVDGVTSVTNDLRLKQ